MQDVKEQVKRVTLDRPWILTQQRADDEEEYARVNDSLLAALRQRVAVLESTHASTMPRQWRAGPEDLDTLWHLGIATRNNHTEHHHQASREESNGKEMPLSPEAATTAFDSFVTADGSARRTSADSESATADEDSVSAEDVSTTVHNDEAALSLEQGELNNVAPDPPELTKEVEAMRAKYQLDKDDTDSAQVQVAILTARMRYMAEQLKNEHEKDKASVRDLKAMQSKRTKLLFDLLKSEPAECKRIISELSIPMGRPRLRKSIRRKGKKGKAIVEDELEAKGNEEIQVVEEEESVDDPFISKLEQLTHKEVIESLEARKVELQRENAEVELQRKVKRMTELQIEEAKALGKEDAQVDLNASETENRTQLAARSYAALKDKLNAVALRQRNKLLSPREVIVLSKALQRNLNWTTTREKLETALNRSVGDNEMAAELELSGGREEYQRELLLMDHAKQILIESNFRLVCWIANKYLIPGFGLSLSDLIAEGSVGLIKGAERFDPHRGFRFSTYVTWWIKQHILKAITEDQSMIKLPMSMHNSCMKLKKARREFLLVKGRDGTDNEIANMIGITTDKIKSIERAIAMSTTVSADNAIKFKRKPGEGREKTYATMMRSETPDILDKNYDTKMKIQLRESIEVHLSKREARVLCMRFGLMKNQQVPSTLQEIGEDLEVTRERVRQIEFQALQKLRRSDAAASLASWATLSEESRHREKYSREGIRR
jgi:ribosomal protein S15